MIVIAKCTHCEYIDYLNVLPKKCPRCNSKMMTLEDAFANETIQVVIEDTDRRKNKVDVTFAEVGKTVEGIIGKTLDEFVIEEIDKYRLKFMIRAYVWNLLNKEPQLWLHVGSITNNIKELLTLKILMDKNKYCAICKDKGYREKFESLRKKGQARIVGTPT